MTPRASPSLTQAVGTAARGVPSVFHQWGRLPLVLLPPSACSILLLPDLPLPRVWADPQRDDRPGASEKAPGGPPGAVPPVQQPAGGGSAALASPGALSPQHGPCYSGCLTFPLSTPRRCDSHGAQHCAGKRGPRRRGCPVLTSGLTAAVAWLHPDLVATVGCMPLRSGVGSPACLCGAHGRRGREMAAHPAQPHEDQLMGSSGPAGHRGDRRHRVFLTPAGGVDLAGAPGPHQVSEDQLHVPGVLGRVGSRRAGGPGARRHQVGSPSFRLLAGNVGAALPASLSGWCVALRPSRFLLWPGPCDPGCWGPTRVIRSLGGV